jgi:hypothetical protein
MNSTDRELLRRLAIGDQRLAGAVVASDRTASTSVDDSTAAVVRLAAVAALGIGGEALSGAKDACLAAGTSRDVIEAVVARASAR